MTQIPASDRIVGRGAEAGTSGGCPPRAGFRRADPLGQMRMKMPGGDGYRVLPFAVAGLAAVVLSGLFSTRAAALPTNGAGDQWIAKQYSEVLGRAPGASGWGHYLRKVHGARCTSANLHRQGVRF